MKGKKIVRGIMIPVLILMLLTACASTSYYEYGTYDEFETYQADFESIATLVQANGTGTYIILDSYELEKDNVMIDMSEEQKESLTNVVTHCYGYTYNGHEFDYIDVTEDYIYFNYEAIGCGVMYTQDVKESIKQITNHNEDYGSLKLATDWYGIYR